MKKNISPSIYKMVKVIISMHLIGSNLRFHKVVKRYSDVWIHRKHYALRMKLC